MNSTPNRHAIAGSERRPFAGAVPIGPIRDDERVEVTLRVRPKAPLGKVVPGTVFADARPNQRTYLTREQHECLHGASPADLALVAKFAASHGLLVVESNSARRSIVLTGPARAMKSAFGVDLQAYRHAGGTYRGRVGAVTVPQALVDVVEGVFGLDNRPQAAP